MKKTMQEAMLRFVNARNYVREMREEGKSPLVVAVDSNDPHQVCQVIKQHTLSPTELSFAMARAANTGPLDICKGLVQSCSATLYSGGVAQDCYQLALLDTCQF